MNTTTKKTQSRGEKALLPLTALLIIFLPNFGCANKKASEAASSAQKLQEIRQEGINKTLNDPSVPESVKANIRAHGAPPPPSASGAIVSGK